MRNMFDDFLEELRRRQAEREAGGRPEERSREDGEMRTGGPGSQDTERDDDGGSPVFRRGGLGGRRRTFGPADEVPEIHVGRGWIILGIVALVLVALLVVFALCVDVATDAIWFQSVGYGNVFWTRLGSQILFFATGAVLAFLVLWLNLWLAGRFIPKGDLRRFSFEDLVSRFSVERYFNGGDFDSGLSVTPRSRTGKGEMVQVPDAGRMTFWILLGIGALIALGLGGVMLGNWNTIQLFLHRVPFGQTDPTFGKDIGFFLFELPFYRLVQSYANDLLLVTLLMVGARYLVAVASGASMSTRARTHVAILAALYLWSAAIGYQLDRYELVYSTTSGIFQGASYTDNNARMLAMNVMTALTAFVGCFIVGFSITRWRTPVVLTLAVWAGAFVILQVAYPQLVQRLVVEPNQQAQESSYISSNIDMTRLAFNLDGWAGRTYTPGLTVTAADVAAEPATIQNVRLWDYRPLGGTLDGIQVVRQYYTFLDVDTDRYVFTDAASCTDAASRAPSPAPCVRQVMLAGRELDPTELARLTQGDQSWVNQHITYTHGYGLALVPVNEVQGGSGQPRLLVKDFPPTSVKGVPLVKVPQIYFGTSSSNYVIVNAQSDEFDYPSATGGDQYIRWTGTSGIKLDTTLSRILFAARFGDLNMLISSQITGSSQLLYDRSIQERVHAIAPFLRYDKDPYLVLRPDGSLVYVQDAFTTSASFPNANAYDPGSDSSKSGLAGDAFNYIRNSVKVVMNAYDGTMTFYVADAVDPIIQAWQGVFPGVFKSISEMPVDLRGDPANSAASPGHLRYPEDMFNAQTAQFARYHVTDPSVFYQGSDAWQVPPSADTGGGDAPLQLGLEAYYVEMRVPGQPNPEFVLLQPMVLQGRQNMIAWVAAHNDPAAYGQVSVFDFPRTSTVFGPQQIEALIRQNGEISNQLTLWNKEGSKVIMGNLLVLPLQYSLLYVEPVYLQASNNGLPILQKVIAATPTQVVWGDTLQQALDLIYAGKGATGTGTGTTPGASPTPTASASLSPPTGTPTALPSVSLSTNVQDLVAQINAHFAAAQTAAGKGDWTTYGREMAIVQQLLAQLTKVVGTPAPSGP